ncbi:MAG: pyridoxal phosphate-dependent aminotransferase [Candidatus Pacebacteria bacterium]|jgi:aspartate/methionine/tyrosine aminotransferase|nr:pyridoxal phosphate-dependent aminotransferase [Candidatus Paceibacterota bacterium]MBT4651950.1 pyridoxal phosphate-dependent aminotransferase [Candidatus Paceibacterota bacterium]MBT6755972.1 pyridoxal phosphate-dependent aminotransferase [Candidatus Paceibacterota bacterium]
MLYKNGIDLKPTLTYAILAKAQEFRDRGHVVLDTAFGRNDLTQCLPETLIKKFQEVHSNKKVLSPISQYYDPQGLPKLRQLIADEEQERIYKKAGLKITADNVFIPPTSKGGLDYVTSLLSAAVVIDDCAYPSYAPLAKINSCPVFRYSYKSMDEFDKAIKKSLEVKDVIIVVLTNPNNPSGRLFSRKDLKERAEVMQRNSSDKKTIICLADEIYDRIVYPDYEFVSMAEIYPLTLRSCGYSKNEALAGLRLGKLIVSPELSYLIKDFKSIATHRHGSVNCAAQLALTEIYNKDISKELDGKSTYSLIQEFYLKESLIYALISKKSLEVIKEVFDVEDNPGGSFYALIKLRSKYKKMFLEKGITTGIALAEYILEETMSTHKVGIPLLPVSGFGGEDSDFSFRIVFKYCDDYQKAFDSLDIDFVKKLFKEKNNRLDSFPNADEWYEKYCSLLKKGLEGLVKTVRS